jgi:hypothetical protein
MTDTTLAEAPARPRRILPSIARSPGLPRPTRDGSALSSLTSTTKIMDG